MKIICSRMYCSLMIALLLATLPSCQDVIQVASTPTPRGSTSVPSSGIIVTVTNTLCSPVLPNENPRKDPFITVLEEFSVIPPSGYRIYGLIRRPDPQLYMNKCFPAVILVPGGINPGRTAAYDEDAKMLSASGMVVVTFNAEGRVDTRSEEDIRSEGTEGYNGFRDQDDLCAVVEYTMALDYVVTGNVGISSQSYGITMAAGCLGRHPEIGVKYLVDGEGPPDSFVTCHEPESLDSNPANDKTEVIYGIFGHYSTYRDPSPENQAFWTEREAIRFIGAFRGRYLRLQATWDHAQPPANQSEIQTFTLPPLWWHNKHATDMANAAVAGDVPWVRVNLQEQGNPVNETYDFDHPPVFLPGELADQPWAVQAILEMACLP